MRRIVKFALGGMAVIFFSGPLAAQPASISGPNYEGKTINLYVGYPPGGLYDHYARAIGRHLHKHLRGAPAIRVQNMPGAATLRAARYVYSVAPQDGTAIVATSSSMPFQGLFEDLDANFDPVKANWLPSPSPFTAITVVWYKSPVQTIDDLRKKELVMATLAPGSTPHFIASVMNAVLGTKIKLITGHPNMNSSLLAMESGEIDGYPTVPMTALLGRYKNQWEEGRFHPLLQIGARKHKAAGDVPLLRDVVTNEADKVIIDLATAPLGLGFPYMMGPNVSPEYVSAMRSGFMNVFSDTEFLKDAQKLTLEIDPISGTEVQARIQAAYNAPVEIRNRIKGIFKGR